MPQFIYCRQMILSHSGVVLLIIDEDYLIHPEEEEEEEQKRSLSPDEPEDLRPPACLQKLCLFGNMTTYSRWIYHFVSAARMAPSGELYQHIVTHTVLSLWRDMLPFSMLCTFTGQAHVSRAWTHIFRLPGNVQICGHYGGDNYMHPHIPNDQPTPVEHHTNTMTGP